MHISGRSATCQSPHPTALLLSSTVEVYRGVAYNASTGWWHPRLRINGTHIITPTYRTAREAALGYDHLAQEHYGDNAVVNFKLDGTATSPAHRASRQPSVRKEATSRFRGVSSTRNGKWRAWLTRVGDSIAQELGTYDTEQLAAQAYDIPVLYFHDDGIETSDTCNAHRQAISNVTASTFDGAACVFQIDSRKACLRGLIKVKVIGGVLRTQGEMKKVVAASCKLFLVALAVRIAKGIRRR
jgi:hypothetical protein